MRLDRHTFFMLFCFFNYKNISYKAGVIYIFVTLLFSFCHCCWFIAIITIKIRKILEQSFKAAEDNAITHLDEQRLKCKKPFQIKNNQNIVALNDTLQLESRSLAIKTSVFPELGSQWKVGNQNICLSVVLDLYGFNIFDEWHIFGWLHKLW